MFEIWKPIKNYESLYEVSSLGNIKGIKYNKLLKPYNDKGYLKISLCKKGKVTKFFVHRLVAEAFLKNELNKPQVNHINGCKLTNTVDNLEWVTCSENHEHAYKLGLKNSAIACPKIGNNKGTSSKYMYVTYFKNTKEEKYQATLSSKNFTRSKSFSVKRYGAEAELLAAKAANELIDKYIQFNNRPKNII